MDLEQRMEEKDRLILNLRVRFYSSLRFVISLSTEPDQFPSSGWPTAFISVASSHI